MRVFLILMLLWPSLTLAQSELVTGEATAEGCGDIAVAHADAVGDGCGDTKIITRTWTADDGTSDVELTLAAGTYWVHAVAHENAQAATAATYTLHMSTNSGFTPDADIEEFYTSDADITLPSGVYDAFLAPVPITVPVAGKVYIRVVPDAGTTTGALDLYTTPNA